MALCVTVIPAGTQLYPPLGPSAAIAQNHALLALSSEGSECAPGELTLYTRVEVDAIAFSPFVMSLADGAALSTLILGVWVVAAAARWLMRALDPEADR